ncbi:hypothetical protein Afil01_27980 [Actinorhabdospora filicis]|uniref:Uncharacterized protein n=1 Tax=Actinorhabdospora filicis TaxID=1785913 RepID=A0A9W6W9W7_9ACTN|nr:hypothetical protein [Actinorhabdospora filicis]GLZ77991.1 hypothetical protein Afil01_27980 [Actinorhabdospora filicis]
MRARWGLAAMLLVLAPVCAEYLSGYDDSTGSPATLLGNLVIFVPLYGAPALLIRELARRYGVGWPGIIALAAAAGVVQAGVIDQSMFSQSYRGIDYWTALTEGTFIAPLGLSATTAIAFTTGHALWSFGAPIALTEAAGRSREPWLKLPGLLLAAVLYLGAAFVVLRFHLETETDHATPAQITGAAAVALALVVFAFTRGTRRAPARERRVPAPVPAGLIAFVLAGAFQFMPETWLGATGAVLLLALAAVLISWMARSSRWTMAHQAAMAAGGLATSAAAGFFSDPIGDVDPVARYIHNTAAVLLVLALGAVGMRRRAERTPASPAPAHR